MQILENKFKTMTISQIMAYLGSIKGIEQRIKEIEQTNLSGMPLDDQEKLLDEYNKLWAEMNNNVK